MDLIERQAAIEIIQSMYTGMPRVPWMRKYWQKRYEPYIRTENAIRKLPSVQSEIIRCKDCKYGDTFHKFDEPDMPMKCIGQHYGGTYPDDFCSYAERREDDTQSGVN